MGCGEAEGGAGCRIGIETSRSAVAFGDPARDESEARAPPPCPGSPASGVKEGAGAGEPSDPGLLVVAPESRASGARSGL